MDLIAEFPKYLARTAFIDGKYSAVRSEESIWAIDPSTGEHLLEIGLGDSSDIDAAVLSANVAFEKARIELKPQDRQNLLLRLAELIEENVQTLGSLQAQEMGMPLTIARGAVASCVEFCRYYAGWATKLYGETIETSAPGEFHAYTLREPIGVVAGIIPWNAPIPSAFYKLCPAICTGNAIILKPAEEASLCVLALGEILNEAGFPPGLVNIVAGRGEIAGEALSSHEGVGKVAFTGSAETARHILRASATNMKRVTFELGGKSPDIIMADANLEKAIPQAGWAVFGLTGQLCVAGTRIFVERPIYDEFVEKLKAYAESLKIGPSHQEGVQLGPLVSAAQLERVESYFALGKEQPNNIATGGERLVEGNYSNGYFVPPTIFTNFPNESQIAQEEIFGPVATVLPFDTIEEVVKLSNATQYGLAAGVYTDKLSDAHLLAKRLQAGVVWINQYGASDPSMSFGGTKHSGYGREKGRLALDDYTQIKNIWVGLS